MMCGGEGQAWGWGPIACWYQRWVAQRGISLLDRPAPASLPASLPAPLPACPPAVRKTRTGLGVVPSMKRVDTCAAEFEAGTPYMYSSYDGECECAPTNDAKVGGWLGPNGLWAAGRAGWWVCG